MPASRPARSRHCNRRKQGRVGNPVGASTHTTGTSSTMASTTVATPTAHKKTVPPHPERLLFAWGRHALRVWCCNGHSQGRMLQARRQQRCYFLFQCILQQSEQGRKGGTETAEGRALWSGHKGMHVSALRAHCSPTAGKVPMAQLPPTDQRPAAVVPDPQPPPAGATSAFSHSGPGMPTMRASAPCDTGFAFRRMMSTACNRGPTSRVIDQLEAGGKAQPRPSNQEFSGVGGAARRRADSVGSRRYLPG